MSEKSSASIGKYPIDVILKEIILALSVIVATAVTFFFGIGIIRGYSFLMWLFLLPSLFYASSRPFLAGILITFTAIFSGYFWQYAYEYHSIPPFVQPYLPKLMVLQGAAINALLFALIISIACFAMSRARHWMSIFVLPVLWTSYEYGVMIMSSTGANDSLAYTQASWLSLIQIISITGVWIITFLLILIPSTTMYIWRFRKNKSSIMIASSVTLMLLISILGYGEWRLNAHKNTTPISVGITALPATISQLKSNPIKTTEQYIKQIKLLAQQGAKIILTPEKMIHLTPAYSNKISTLLATAAKKNKVTLIIGFNQLPTTSMRGRNSATVFNPQGQIVLQYYKQQMVTFSSERNYLPGHKIGLFKLPQGLAGVAICHDMDFQSLVRRYSKAHIGVIFVPAFDFFADAWLHARIAIMDGVVGGFSVVRAGQWGNLSVSDDLGRVIALKPTSLQHAVLLHTQVQVNSPSIVH